MFHWQEKTVAVKCLIRLAVWHKSRMWQTDWETDRNCRRYKNLASCSKTVQWWCLQMCDCFAAKYTVGHTKVPLLFLQYLWQMWTDFNNSFTFGFVYPEYGQIKSFTAWWCNVTTLLPSSSRLHLQCNVADFWSAMSRLKTSVLLCAKLSTKHRRQRRRGHRGQDPPIFDLQGSISVLDPPPNNNTYTIMHRAYSSLFSSTVWLVPSKNNSIAVQ